MQVEGPRKNRVDIEVTDEHRQNGCNIKKLNTALHQYVFISGVLELYLRATCR